MKKWMPIILFLLLIPIVSADFYTVNSSFKPRLTRFTYLIPVANMTNDILILGTTCLNITGGRLAGTRCIDENIDKENFICEIDNDCFLPFTCSLRLVCELDTTEFVLTECPARSTARSIMLGGMTGTGLFFTGMGIVTGIPFVGFFGGTMLMPVSWNLSTCEPTTGFILGLMSMLIMILFAVRGFLRRKMH